MNIDQESEKSSNDEPINETQSVSETPETIEESKPRRLWETVAVKKSSFMGLVKKHPTIAALLLGLIAIFIVILKKNAEITSQKALITKQAEAQIETHQAELLKLIAKPMVWSIRAEMLRMNLEQVNLLISEIVKEGNFIYIHIIQPDGNVLLSTNKKLEGQQIGTAFEESLLKVEAPFVTYQDEKEYLVVAPIMGIDSRLGILVFGYTPKLLKIE